MHRHQLEDKQAEKDDKINHRAKNRENLLRSQLRRMRNPLSCVFEASAKRQNKGKVFAQRASNDAVDSGGQTKFFNDTRFRHTA